ncbi:MAG: potassium channel family protein [Vibrio sp.]
MKRKITQANNFYYLTFALIALLVLSALTKELPSNLSVVNYILQALVISTFAVCLFSLRFGQGWFKFLLTLSGLWLIASIARNLLDIQQMDLIVLPLMFCFFLGTFKAIAKQILFTGSVDFNKIVGSLALFLLLGLIWTTAYLFILELMPNAFTGIEATSWGDNFSQLAYFSFVTLTTLGYGDISPITPFAEVIVYLEAITGVFYMAIVVASLVSSTELEFNQTNRD